MKKNKKMYKQLLIDFPENHKNEKKVNKIVTLPKKTKK
jgi:hypothetical protein